MPKRLDWCLPPSTPALQWSLHQGALHRTEKCVVHQNAFLEDGRVESYLTSKVCRVAMVAVVVTVVSVNPIPCHLVPTTPHLRVGFKKDYQQREGNMGKLKKILDNIENLNSQRGI